VCTYFKKDSFFVLLEFYVVAIQFFLLCTLFHMFTEINIRNTFVDRSAVTV
jgi:hypothetical protein